MRSARVAWVVLVVFAAGAALMGQAIVPIGKIPASSGGGGGTVDGTGTAGQTVAWSDTDTLADASATTVFPGRYRSTIPDVNAGSFTAPVLAGAGAGSVSNGTHRYKIALCDTTTPGTGCTGSGGTATSAVTVTDNTVNGRVTVTVPYVCEHPYGYIHIFRDKDSDGVYKHVGHNNWSCATTYQDNVADGSLGITMPTANTAQHGIEFTGGFLTGSATTAWGTPYTVFSDGGTGIGWYLYGDTPQDTGTTSIGTSLWLRAGSRKYAAAADQQDGATLELYGANYSAGPSFVRLAGGASSGAKAAGGVWIAGGAASGSGVGGEILLDPGSSGSGTPGQVRFGDLTSNGVLATTLGNGTVAVDATITAGTWTPTLTNVANLAGSTAFQCQYLRIGATVTGSCRFSVDPTTTVTSTQLGVSLPVASNFGAVEDAAGACGGEAVAGETAAVRADASNDRMEVRWQAADVTDHVVTCSFSYQVI